MVWRNVSSADLEGYTISDQQIIGANHMGAVGLDWHTVTMGRFGSAPDGLILQSQSTGVLGKKIARLGIPVRQRPKNNAYSNGNL